MSEYFPEPKISRETVKVELDLSNYATKADLKNATAVDTSHLAKKDDLANWKFNIDKLDIDKLKILITNLSNSKRKIDQLDFEKLVGISVDSSKLRDVVKNYVVKKDVYNAKIKNIEYKKPDITNLTTNTTVNAKMNEVKKTNITILGIAIALNTKINKINT